MVCAGDEAASLPPLPSDERRTSERNWEKRLHFFFCFPVQNKQHLFSDCVAAYVTSSSLVPDYSVATFVRAHFSLFSLFSCALPPLKPAAIQF